MQDNADPVLLGDHDVALASIEKVVVGKYNLMPNFYSQTRSCNDWRFIDKYYFNVTLPVCVQSQTVLTVYDAFCCATVDATATTVAPLYQPYVTYNKETRKLTCCIVCYNGVCITSDL